MSREVVERIMGRAVADASFRNMLVTNPDEVLCGQDVTPDEIQMLRSMDWSAVGSAGRDLDARISRSGLIILGGGSPSPPGG